MKIDNFIVFIIVLILLLGGVFIYLRKQKKPSSPTSSQSTPLPPLPTPSGSSPPPQPNIITGCGNRFKPSDKLPGCVICPDPTTAYDHLTKRCIEWEKK